MHERVIELNDPKIGLRGFLAIHTTKPGPAHGGTRIASYPDLKACKEDALRLSEAMTWKCLINEIPGGGGKLVLMKEPIKDRRAVFLALGELVESLKGKFYTGTDVGVTSDDLAIMRERTGHIACDDLSQEASDGVFYAIRGALEFLEKGFWNLEAVVQGLGSVGAKLAERLVKEGVKVEAGDPDSKACDAAERFGARIVPHDQLLVGETDMFCPCALGGVLNRETANSITCKLIVGAANNPLSHSWVADRLHSRGIVYVPDFLSNSGATIRGAWQNLRGSAGRPDEIGAIRRRTFELLTEAKKLGLSPLKTAMRRLKAQL